MSALDPSLRALDALAHVPGDGHRDLDDRFEHETCPSCDGDGCFRCAYHGYLLNVARPKSAAQDRAGASISIVALPQYGGKQR